VTDKQITRKAASLHARAQRAFNAYRIARGARKDAGKNVESYRETKARIKSYTLLGEYAAFCREHNIDSLSLSY
jgi:hypothetical protein